MSVTIAFSTLSLLCDQHSRQMSVLHSTTLKRSPLLIFPALSGKRPCVVCSATLTILLSDLASLQPNWHACLLCCITQGATLIFECFYVKCWETLKKLKEIFDKLTMHLRSLRAFWFFRSRVAENSFLLRYGSASKCNGISTFSYQWIDFIRRFRWGHYIASKRRYSITHCGSVMTQKNTICTYVLTIKTESNIPLVRCNHKTSASRFLAYYTELSGPGSSVGKATG